MTSEHNIKEKLTEVQRRDEPRPGRVHALTRDPLGIKLSAGAVDAAFHQRASIICFLLWSADRSGHTEREPPGWLWDVLFLPGELAVVVPQALVQVNPGNVQVVEVLVVAAQACEAADQVTFLADVVGHCRLVGQC